MNRQAAFEQLDNKGKCLEMWNYIAETPAATKDDFYRAYNIDVEEVPVNSCYACVEGYTFLRYEGHKRIGVCDCPVKWSATMGEPYACESKGTDYNIWQQTHYMDAEQAAARAIVFLVEDTWKEE